MQKHIIVTNSLQIKTIKNLINKKITQIKILTNTKLSKIIIKVIKLNKKYINNIKYI
jgi:hypothetical protein